MTELWDTKMGVPSNRSFKIQKLLIQLSWTHEIFKIGKVKENKRQSLGVQQLGSLHKRVPQIKVSSRSC